MAPRRRDLSVELPLEIGDKLKLSFDETIDIGAMKQSGRDRVDLQGALRTFYYAVGQDADISIPLLGWFQTKERALDDVRADVAVSFMVVIGRSANEGDGLRDLSHHLNCLTAHSGNVQTD
jgi:hypothetical protein